MDGAVYVGIDLGKRFHQVAVVDGEQRELLPSFRIGRGQAGLNELLQAVTAQGVAVAETVFTIEATTEWWNALAWPLSEQGYRVYLAPPTKAHALRRFYAQHTKTDVTDAAALARLPLVDPGLKPLWRPSPACRSLLRLCRLRWKGRCRIADLKRRISHLAETVQPGIDLVLPVRYSQSGRLYLRRYLAPERAKRLGKKRLGDLMLKASWGKLSAERLDALWACVQDAPALGLHADELQLEINAQLDELEAVEAQVARLDARIAELYGQVDPGQRLLAVRGLGEFLAAALTAHIGDVERFPSAKALIAYAGLAPRVKASAGHTSPGQSITKKGSPYLRAWAFLGASCCRQFDPALKAYYQRLRTRDKHYLLATCATAARLLERVYDLLSEEVSENSESLGQRENRDSVPTRRTA